MKMLGLLLVVVCSSLTGMTMASGLSRRVREMENHIALLGMIYDRLRYLQPPMESLLFALCGMEQFKDTLFLQRCRDMLREGIPFPQCWRQSLELEAMHLGREQVQILIPLGEVLGCTDLESQLTALRHASSMLENSLGRARQYKEKNARLYRSLGILGGMALAIVLM